MAWQWSSPAAGISGIDAMLLLKESRHVERIIRTRIDSEEDDQLNGIRCPRCSWRPSPHDLWCCHAEDTPEPPFPSCGTEWNTFSTHGRCPGCSHQWRWTSCLLCGEWSPHEDWYEHSQK
jgi:hypothetical protein